MSKTRSDSKLLNLPEEQQSQLAEWLLDGIPYHKAREMVMNEFGVKVGSLSAFTAFWEEVCAPALLAKRTRAAGVANEVAANAEKQLGRFDEATLDLIRAKAMELAMAPGSKVKDVKSLFALVQKNADQDIKRTTIEIKKAEMSRKEKEFELEKQRLEIALEKHREAMRQIKAALDKDLHGKAGGQISEETLRDIEEKLKLL